MKKMKLKTQEFVRRTRIEATAEELFAWHAEPGALERLTPPWERVEVLDEGGGIEDGAEVVLRIHLGPVPVRWVARLSGCVPGRQFRDTQVRGPFAFWRHTHRMEPDGPAASWLEDRVEWALPCGVMGRWLGGWLVRRKLARMFEHRHRATVEDLALRRRRRVPFRKVG
jgi:ligand-binding SRPBCC domain-containing protein